MNFKENITVKFNAAAKIFAVAVFISFCALSVSFGEPAYPGAIEVEQPDGSKVSVRLFGDEFYNWAEDIQGYTVLQDLQTKEWVYAGQDAGGALKPTSGRVGRASPQSLGLRKGLKDGNYLQIRSRRMEAMKLPEPLKAQRAERGKAFSAGEAQREPVNPVSRKNLVVLVAFSDKPFITPNPQQSFNNLFNQTGYSVNGAAGSVKEFFSAASYGNYIVDSAVTHVVTADKTSAYYAGTASQFDDNVPELVREVVEKLDDEGFNFRQCSSDGTNLDCLTIIYAGRGQATGGGSDTIWPHAYSISPYTTRDGIRVSRYNCANELRDSAERMVGLGTIVHEISHALFGLPDLYDTSGSPTHEGVGEYCLMSGGSHAGNGYTPALWSAWCKYYLGVTSAINLPDDTDITILDSALNDNNIYKLKGPQFYTGSGANPKEEYFLIENRNGGGFDKGIPQYSAAIGRGLLIWHIDESRNNNNSPNAERLMVGLEEANGQKNLINNRRPAGVYFKASNNASYNFTSFTDDTNPNSRSYDGNLAGKPITLISAPGASMTFRVRNGGAAEAAIRSIAPAESKRGVNNLNITIDGTNFLTGSTVKLVKAGNSAITANAVTYVSAGRLTAAFNIPDNAAAGYWDLTVSSSGYIGDITKTGIFVVLGNTMAVNNVSPDIGIRGRELTVNVAGTDFQSGAGVKLTNEGASINGTVVSRSGTTGITASFMIPSRTFNGTQFDLTVTNASGDYAVKTQAVTIYNPLTIINFSPIEIKTGSLVDLTVNGSGFKNGYAKVILKDASNESRTITVSVMSVSPAQITGTFTAPSSSGMWKVYVAAYNGGPEYAAQPAMSIVTENASTHDLLAYAGAVIKFQVMSKNGAENTGTMIISEGTFSERTKVSVRQRSDFAPPYSHVRELKHTNVGVNIDTEGKLPGKEIELKIPYNESDIAEMQEERLVISRYDEEKSAWVPLKSAVDKANKLVTAYIEHLSVFAIMGVSVPAQALEDARYYPNPIQPSKGLSYARMNFSNMPAGTRIKIYTMLGQVVRSLEADAGGMAVWDGKNDRGEKAASGVYIAYMEDGAGNKKRIKIAMER